MQTPHVPASVETIDAQRTFNPAVDPHVIAIQSNEDRPPVAFGIRYLGGLAVLNPDQHKMPARTAEALLYAAIGFDQPTALSHLRISEHTYKTQIDRGHDILAINYRSGILQRSLSLGIMVLLRRATTPLIDVTRRERQVLELLPIVGRNSAIAKELYVQSPTVKEYMTRMHKRFGVSHRETLAVGAVMSGFTNAPLVSDERAAAITEHYKAQKQASKRPFALFPFARPCNVASDLSAE